MRRHLRPIHPILDLRHVSPIILHLALYAMPIPRAGVRDVLCLRAGGRVERVEGDFATAFPFRHVDFGRPGGYAREPEGGPCLWRRVLVWMSGR